MLQYILTNLHRSSPNLQRPSLQLLYSSQVYTIKACQSVYHISPSIFSLNKNLFTKVVVLGPFLCYGLFHHSSGQLCAACFKRRAYANASMKGQYITDIMCSHFALHLDRFPCLSSLILCVVLLCCRRIKKKKKKKKRINKQNKKQNVQIGILSPCLASHSHWYSNNKIMCVLTPCAFFSLLPLLLPRQHKLCVCC